MLASLRGRAKIRQYLKTLTPAADTELAKRKDLQFGFSCHALIVPFSVESRENRRIREMRQQKTDGAKKNT